MKPIVCFVITKVELVVSFRVRHHSSPSNISMTAKKLPSLPSSVVSKTCSTLAQCLRQLFERSALSKRPYPTPVVLGDRQDSIGRETDPSQLSQPAGMPMPMPNRQVCPCPIGSHAACLPHLSQQMARGRSQKRQTKMRQKGATNDFANICHK